MPEELPEGFNPDDHSIEYTAAEGEAIREAADATTWTTLVTVAEAQRGLKARSEQRDSHGQTILRTENWNGVVQATQFEHRANGSRHESGKILKHATEDWQVGKLVEREYPNEPVEFSLDGLGSGLFQGQVESYGWTSQQSAQATKRIAEHNQKPENADKRIDEREPWLTIVSTDPGLLEAVRARLTPSDIQHGGDGKRYARLRGSFGSMAGFDLGPELVDVRRVGRLDADIAPDGRVTKVTLGKVDWVPPK